MKFMHRNRRFLSIVTLLAILLGGSVTPASAVFDPETGRFLQCDPNGMGIVLQQALSYRARNPVVTVSAAYELQFADGMNFYEYLQSNPGNGTDPSGLWTYTDTLATAGIAGGLYAMASTYAHYGDYDPEEQCASNWRLAASFAMGAGMGTVSAMGFGWLSGALAGYAGVSVGVAATSIGLMTSPALLGLAIYEYKSAETYADRVMAQVDVGFSMTGLAATHAPLFKVANPSTVAALETIAARVLRKLGPGSGPGYGIRAHKLLEVEVDALGKSLTSEVPYLNGKALRPKTRPGGSVVADVVEGPLERPIAIYDLKTGTGKLTPGRIAEIREHLPKGSENIPIVEIRGD